MSADVKAIEAVLERLPAERVAGYDEARFALAECCTPERMRRLLDERAQMVEALRGMVSRYEHDGVPNDSEPTLQRARAALARAEGGE